MEIFGETLGVATALFLLLALLMALGFEFVNGFHDTANAVATVIYTHSLKPWIAVTWSGLWNLIGVLSFERGGRLRRDRAPCLSNWCSTSGQARDLPWSSRC